MTNITFFHSLMALLELTSHPDISCDTLIACVDRTASGSVSGIAEHAAAANDEDEVQNLTRDLKWVGFELMMLDAWAGEKGCLSDRWLFLGMDA